MFPWQCEDLSINHLTLLLVMTMPYASWFLWRADYIEDFKWHLHFQLGVAFWRVVLRELYFEEPNHVWRALKASLLNIGTRQTLSTPYELWGGGVKSGRGQPSWENFDMSENCCPTRPTSKKKLPLHSWRPLDYKSHIECTSPSRSKIQYTCALPSSK